MTHQMIQETSEGAVLSVHVQPGAKRTEYAGVHGNALKFKVAAPQVEGAANEALCGYLAERFGLPTQAVTVCSGATSRRKRIVLKGVPGHRVRQTLAIGSSSESIRS